MVAAAESAVNLDTGGEDAVESRDRHAKNLPLSPAMTP